MLEIKDMYMYNRHPSIKSITIIARRVVSIDFYRLIDKIDDVYVIDIDSYRFIKRFSDIEFLYIDCPGRGLVYVSSKEAEFRQKLLPPFVYHCIIPMIV